MTFRGKVTGGVVVFDNPALLSEGTVVEVRPVEEGKTKEQSTLADWVEVQVERNGTDQARYPLRGSVVRYEQPTEPVAEGDWEAMRDPA